MSTPPDKDLKRQVYHFFCAVLEKINKPVYYEIIRGHASHAPENVKAYIKKHLKEEDLLMYFKHRKNYFDVNWHKEVSLKKKQVNVSSATDVRKETCAVHVGKETCAVDVGKGTCAVGVLREASRKNENCVYKDETQTPKSKCENGQLPCPDNRKHPAPREHVVSKEASSSANVSQKSKPSLDSLKLEKTVISWYIKFLLKKEKIHHKQIGNNISRVIKDLMSSNNSPGEVVDFFKCHSDVFCVDEGGFIKLQNHPHTSTAYLLPTNRTKTVTSQDNAQEENVQKNSHETSSSLEASHFSTEPKGFSLSSQKGSEKNARKGNAENSTSKISSSVSKISVEPSWERTEKKGEEKISSEKNVSLEASCSSAGPTDFSESSQESIKKRRAEEISSEASDSSSGLNSVNENNQLPEKENININVKEISAVCFFADILSQHGPVYLEKLKTMGMSSPELVWCSKLKMGKFRKLLQNYPYLFVIKHTSEVNLCNSYEGKLKCLRDQIRSPDSSEQHADGNCDSSSVCGKNEDIKNISVDSSTANTKSYPSRYSNAHNVESNNEDIKNISVDSSTANTYPFGYSNTHNVENNNEDIKTISVDSSTAKTKSYPSGNSNAHNVENNNQSHNDDSYHEQRYDCTVTKVSEVVFEENDENCGAATISESNSSSDPKNNNPSDTNYTLNDNMSVFPVHNEPTCQNNGSTIASISNKSSEAHCTPKNQDPNMFLVCNEPSVKNAVGVSEHAKFLVVWMAELLCFQIYEASGEAKYEAECKAVNYFISEIRNYSKNFLQKFAPYAFLKGKLGQAPPGVSSYISRLYPGKHFIRFFHEHSEFLAIPDSVGLHPPSRSKILKKTSRCTSSFFDFDGFQKKYYTDDFLRLFCAVHGAVKELILFTCRKVNVPLSRLSGKLGSLGSAEQELLRLFEGQSSIEKVRLFLSHFDIIFSIHEQNVSIYEGSDSLLHALQNHILVCVLHSLVRDGNNTTEKLTEAVFGSYPQLMHNIPSLGDFITQNNSSFEMDGDVIISKHCGFINSELLVEVLNLIKENLQDRQCTSYTELLSLVKSHPQLLLQMISEMPITLMYTLKTDRDLISKEGKVSLRCSLEKTLLDAVSNSSPTEVKSVAAESDLPADDIAGSGVLKSCAKPTSVSVHNTNLVKSVTGYTGLNLNAKIPAKSKSRPIELSLKPAAGSLQNTICRLKVRHRVSRTYNDVSDVEGLLQLKSGNKLLVAVNYFRIESGVLTSACFSTIKLELLYLKIPEFYHELFSVKLQKLIFSCVGKHTKNWTMQDLLCLIYEKFRKKYADLFCPSETTVADIYLNFLRFLHCLAKTSEKYYSPLEEACRNTKSNPHSQKNVDSASSVLQKKEQLPEHLEKLNQSFEGRKADKCVKKSGLSVVNNVSAEMVSDNSEPGFGREDPSGYLDKVKKYDLISGLTDKQEKYLHGETHTSVNLIKDAHDDDESRSYEFNFKKSSVSDFTSKITTDSSGNVASEFHSTHVDQCYETDKFVNLNESDALGISINGGYVSQTVNTKTCRLPVIVEDTTPQSLHKDVYNAVNTASGMGIISVVGQVLLLTKDCGMAEITDLPDKHWVYFLMSSFTCAHHSFAKLKLGEKVNCLVPVSEPESKIRLAFLVTPVCCQENLPDLPGTIKTSPSECTSTNNQVFSNNLAANKPSQQSSRCVSKTGNSEETDSVFSTLTLEGTLELQTQKNPSETDLQSVLNNAHVQPDSPKVDNQIPHACDVICSVDTVASVECLCDNNIPSDKDLVANQTDPVNDDVVQAVMIDALVMQAQLIGDLCFPEQQKIEPSASQGTSCVDDALHVSHDVACQTVSTGLVIMTDLYCE